jgi:hypothetical protein
VKWNTAHRRVARSLLDHPRPNSATPSAFLHRATCCATSCAASSVALTEHVRGHNARKRANLITTLVNRWKRNELRRPVDTAAYDALMLQGKRLVPALTAETLHHEVVSAAQLIRTHRGAGCRFNKRVLELIQIRAEIDTGERWTDWVQSGCVLTTCVFIPEISPRSTLKLPHS